MNSQQLGKFTIEQEFVREQPDIVAKALQDMNFVPVRGELVFYNMEIELQGISSKFEAIEKGMVIPEYRIDIFMNQEEDSPKEYSHVEVTKL